MKWVGHCELLSYVVHRKPLWHLIAMSENPFSILAGCFPSLVWETTPFEETASNDLRHFRFSRHDHGLVEPIQELLKAVEIGMVIGRHFIEKRRQGYGRPSIGIEGSEQPLRLDDLPQAWSCSWSLFPRRRGEGSRTGRLLQRHHQIPLVPRHPLVDGARLRESIMAALQS